MQTIIHILLLTRGQKVVAAIEAPVGNPEESQTRIDYLRAVVPANALFAMGALCIAGLHVARDLKTWDAYVLMVVFSWWAISSLVVCWQAHAALKKLE